MLPAEELEPFCEARQTIGGWLSEATAAPQLEGPWSRASRGLAASLLHAALASNLLNSGQRRELLPASGRPIPTRRTWPAPRPAGNSPSPHLPV